MFRCVTELKGLVIDIDSFEDIDFEFWYDINRNYKCLFITVYDETEAEVVQIFGQDRVYKMEKFRKLFAPSRNTVERKGTGECRHGSRQQPNKALILRQGRVGKPAAHVAHHKIQQQISYGGRHTDEIPGPVAHYIPHQTAHVGSFLQNASPLFASLTAVSILLFLNEKNSIEHFL